MASYNDVIQSRNLILKAIKNKNAPNIKSILHNVNYELTSLAALSAALHNKKWRSLKTIIKLLFKYPVKVCKQRRTLAIIKHILFN